MSHRLVLIVAVWGALVWLWPLTALAEPTDLPLAKSGRLQVRARVPLSPEQAAGLRTHSTVRLLANPFTAPVVTVTVRNYADRPQADHRLVIAVTDTHKQTLTEQTINTDQKGIATLPLMLPAENAGWLTVAVTDRTFARAAPLGTAVLFRYQPVDSGTINGKKQTAALFDYEGQISNSGDTFHPLFARARRPALALAR